MDVVVLQWQALYGSLARRLLLRAFAFAVAFAVFPFLQILDDAMAAEPLALNYDDCHLGDGSNPQMFPKGSSLMPMPYFASEVAGASSTAMPCKENGNLTMTVITELMGKNLLDSSCKALCIGDGSASAVLALHALGVSNALGVDRHPFFSILRRRFAYELDFKDNSFDFVFSRALDKVSVPALFVLEVERVLQPGGIGAMLVGAHDFYSGSLIKSATSVSSFLKSSDVVHICGIDHFTLVIFRKRFESNAYFETYHLPDECPSLDNNKPLLKYLEPLDESPGKMETQISYLPKFFNVSSRNRLIYINIGAGEHLNSSIANWLRPLYPKVAPQSLDVYVIDHDPSVLSSYVREAGITFIYHPGLAVNKPSVSFDSDGDYSAYSDDEDFDFVAWFMETVSDRDFVVLAMNARMVELRILIELFKSGAICHVDELFLHCSDSLDCKNSLCGDCLSLFRSLRNSGIFAHKWLGG